MASPADRPAHLSVPGADATVVPAEIEIDGISKRFGAGPEAPLMLDRVSLANTYRAMTAIDPVLFRAAQTMDQRGIGLLLKVAIPAAKPDIATGVRVGWGPSFAELVAAELIAAERGMGFMIMQARQLGEIGVVIFGIILIGATDYAIGAAIRRRIGRWHVV